MITTHTALQKNVQIRVGNTPINATNPPHKTQNAVCWSDVTGTLLMNNTRTRCTAPEGLIGRYVSVQYVNNATGPLTLCEVQVAGPSMANALPRMRLLWADEFDGDSLDEKKWSHRFYNGE